MPLDLAIIDRASALVDALAGSHADGVDGLVSVPHDGLLRSTRTLGDLVRLVDSLGAIVTRELNRRIETDADFRRQALGWDVGGRFASELLRDLTALDDRQLRDWESVADAIASRTTLQGEPLPGRHEPLAAAVLAGSITGGAAASIARGVDAVADHADAETLGAVEATLVEYAGSLTSRELGRLVRQLPDRFDTDGAEPREEALRQRSRVSIRQLPNGLTRLIADLHPEAAGFLTAALDARTAPRRQVAFADDELGCDCAACHAHDRSAAAARDERLMAAGFLIRLVAIAEVVCTGTVLADTRSLSQRRVDALSDLARESLARDAGAVAGAPVTMLVTVPLEALRSGIGTAEIAGIDEPISAGTARRLAACAEIIPVVLGTHSEPLDLGRTQRLFSRAQRRALAARDKGCIWPGCTAPPAWCEAAHLTAWLLGGPTDLDNAALLCSHHHHRFDQDGWSLQRRHGIPYLIPPPWLDPGRTPRRAGRLPALAA